MQSKHLFIYFFKESHVWILYLQIKQKHNVKIIIATMKY